jgi:hypothetical protein
MVRRVKSKKLKKAQKFDEDLKSIIKSLETVEALNKYKEEYPDWEKELLKDEIVKPRQD